MTEPVRGYGRTVTGGTGGSSVVVTSLNNSGAGTLREALAGTVSDRIVTFSSGLTGAITLTTDIVMQGDNITLDGESNSNVYIDGKSLRIEGTNIIIRYLRCRESSGAGVDNITLIGGSSGIVLDHCSLANGSDECLSGAGGTAGINGTGISDVTVQYCIIGPARPPDGDNALLALWSQAERVSWHHNVFYSSDDRMPRLGENTTSTGIDYDFRMNIIDRWGEYGLTAPPMGMRIEGSDANLNVIQNLWVSPGTNGTADNGLRIQNATPSSTSANVYARGILRNDGGTSFPNAIMTKATEWAVTERVSTYDVMAQALRILNRAGALPHDATDAATVADITSRLTVTKTRRPVFSAGCGVGSGFGPNTDSAGPKQIIG